MKMTCKFLRLTALFISLLFTVSLFAQTVSENPMLLGKITKDSLMQNPYNEWFNDGYRSYTTNRDVLAQLLKADTKDISINIFLGTWCSDSHREIPRFLKILDEMGMPSDKISMVAVSNKSGAIKQSPTGEEKGINIFRAPTMIISKNGKEINRIVEFPVYSLENDLLTILSDCTYSPNYHSYPIIADWLANGTLIDKNVSTDGLAEQLRYKIKNISEITAVASVLESQNKIQEASVLCNIAYTLYPDNSNYYPLYIRISEKNREYDDAIFLIKKSLSKTTDLKEIESLLDLHDKIKLELSQTNRDADR